MLRVSRKYAHESRASCKNAFFAEGSDVKAGQLLYVIDSAPYEAALQNAQAALARAEANLQQTSSQLERYRPLVEANAISKQDFVNAEAAQSRLRRKWLQPRPAFAAPRSIWTTHV